MNHNKTNKEKYLCLFNILKINHLIVNHGKFPLILDKKTHLHKTHTHTYTLILKCLHFYDSNNNMHETLFSCMKIHDKIHFCIKGTVCFAIKD